MTTASYQLLVATFRLTVPAQSNGSISAPNGMTHTSYTGIAAFLALLRIVLSMCLVCAAVPTWWKQNLSATKSEENRSSLLISLAFVVVVLNIASWPLLYALLQSYVEQWPNTMCIYGVTQIGKGTSGLSRLLPTLLDVLQILRPIVLFMSGTAATVYLIDRRTTTSALIRRLAHVTLYTGALTAIDAGIELAYVVLPRTEVQITGGCCTSPLEALERDYRFRPEPLVSQSQRTVVFWGYYGLNTTVIAGLLAATLRKSLPGVFPYEAGFIDAVLGFASLLTLPVGLLFLRSVAAPAILGLPYHQCPYDLVAAAPESLIGVAASLIGTFSLWWAILIPRIAGGSQTRAFMPDIVARLQFVALVGYAASLVLITMELLIA